MHKIKKELLIAFCLLFFITALQAQEAISAAGGNAAGSGGTASYTIGQIACMTQSGSNGITTQGVQQPIEIFTFGIGEARGISLHSSVSPNPATVQVILKIEDAEPWKLTYQLCDMNGKLLERKNVLNNETFISLENLAPSTYMLMVIEDNKEIQSFKIIKN